MTDLDIEYLEKLAARARSPVTLEEGSEPFGYVPEDMAIVSLEQYLAMPTRIHRALIITTLESFNRYYNEFKNGDGPGNSRIYVDGETVCVVGIIDDHQSNKADTADELLASWCDHRVVYKCPYSRQWEAWKTMDRRKVSQVEFAEWLDPHEVGSGDKNQLVVRGHAFLFYIERPAWPPSQIHLI